ncbi:hypothetical protein Ciccas_002250 [Cichlidogyrus casuarinus]|uniref:Rho-GAP domain-containing protein n=1 Tax=Cichlidogyrus casuarinus TaxID=1844966 RepID=A0ABD2QIC3_9PLAT
MYPSRFWELCKLHLSTIVDIPSDFMDTSMERCQMPILQAHGLTRNVKWTSWNPLKNTQEVPLLPARKRLDVNTVTGIISIMEFLSTKDNLMQEGLFRKTGSIVRQKEIKKTIMDQIQQGGSVDIEKLQIPTRKTRTNVKPAPINVHDIASVLKLILSELPIPLLTDELLPVYNQVAELTSGNLNDKGERVPLTPTQMILAQAKQLKSLRILNQYLPGDNAMLLRRLLDLLTDTLENSTSNLMTAEALGTLFGLLLFAPGKSGKALHTTYTNLTQLATLLIREGSKSAFSFPTSLSKDVLANCFRDTFIYKSSSEDSGLCSNSTPSADSESLISINGPLDDLAELPPITTQMVFARSSSPDKTMTPEGFQSTQFAVAELCAQVQALPDNDTRKRRLIQRFNHSNGGITPVPLEKSLQTQSTKRGARSIRGSISKKIRMQLEKDGINASKVNLLPQGEVIPLCVTPSTSSVEANGPFCCPLVETFVTPLIKMAQSATLSGSGRKKRRAQVKRSVSIHSTNMDAFEKSIILDGAFYPTPDTSECDSDIIDDLLEQDCSFVYSSTKHEIPMDSLDAVSVISVNAERIASIRRTKSMSAVRYL